jgi:hypothetical protein
MHAGGTDEGLKLAASCPGAETPCMGHAKLLPPPPARTRARRLALDRVLGSTSFRPAHARGASVWAAGLPVWARRRSACADRLRRYSPRRIEMRPHLSRAPFWRCPRRGLQQPRATCWRRHAAASPARSPAVRAASHSSVAGRVATPSTSPLSTPLPLQLEPLPPPLPFTLTRPWLALLLPRSPSTCLSGRAGNARPEGTGMRGCSGRRNRTGLEAH